MKKSYKLILIIIFGISVLMAACSDNGIKLNNWQNSQIEVNLGDRVEVDTSEAEDAAGNKYPVTVEVTTKAGEKLMLVGYKFLAEDTQGYKIIYTAVINEKTAVTKTVTVNVKDSEKPVLVVSGISHVYANAQFDLPSVTVNDNSGEQINYVIKLYKIEGQQRSAVNFSGTSLSLSAVGEYVFVITATDSSGNTETKEHCLTVLDNKYLNAATIFDDGNSSLIIKMGNPQTEGDYGFDADKKRTAFSQGSAYVDTKAGDTVYEWCNFIILNPVISKQNFISAMEEEGAYLSIWVFVEAQENVDLRFMINWSEHSVKNITSKNEWINFKITKERINEDGYTLDSYFDLMANSGVFMFVRNYGEKDCRIYFDSIYVAKDGEITIDMPESGYSIGDEITINATSEDIDEFIYQISVGNNTVVLDGNKFTPDAPGNYVITVSSAYGYINASATKIISLVPREMKSALIYFDGEGDLGFGVKSGSNIVSAFSSQVKRLAISEGSAYMDTGTSYPNFALTNPLMSKIDFIAAMSEPGAYLSIWVYVETSEEVIGLNFTIDWDGTITRVETKNQWINIKLTKTRIEQSTDGRFNTLEKFYDFMPTRFMMLDNYVMPNCTIYFDSIFIAKDGEITIDMPDTEYGISDEIEITATSEDVDKFVYEVTLGSETRYFTEPKFTPWAAGTATITVKSAYGNINASASVNITIV